MMPLLVGIPVALVLALLGSRGIEAWVGDGFAGAARVLVILAAAQALFALTEPWWSALMGMGRARLVALVTLFEAALNIVLSVLLAGTLGIEGVALGTLLAVAGFEVPVGFALVAREAGISVGTMVRHAVVPHVGPGLVAGAVAVLLANVTPSHPVAVIAAGLGVIVVYLAAFGSLSATPDERRAAVMGLRGLVRRSRTT